MYKLMYRGRRYNTINYVSYEAARKAARKIITKLSGIYQDSVKTAGFSIVKLN
jgi:hypothetical protein